MGGVDTRVRLIDVYRACGGAYHVRSEEYVLRGTSVQQLVGDADVCGSEDVLIRQVNSARRAKGDIASTQYAIAAQCGSEIALHHLPWSQELKFYLLEEKAPQLAALWTLHDIPLGKAQPLVVTTDLEQAKFERHRLAEQAAIDIRGGNFDLAESELPQEWRDQGMLKLSDFVPEIAEATGPELEDLGEVENLASLGVEKYVTIPYPQMAKIAHITGDVALDISIDPVAGSVINVIAKSGHPILKQAATDALAKWVFLHPYSGLNPLPVKVHFFIRCGPTIQTQATTVKSASKKPKKKPKK
jgi:hypothetical protein